MLTLFCLILRNESINFAHYVMAESVLITSINNLLLSDAEALAYALPHINFVLLKV